ncbi:MAG TPA: M20/M25/M40 family metallo-hydrolase [Gemmatimonadales bacterium]|nr:M20/M25/M40 family metallo-hydrolase [Gemmatimonadales bacterium]
MPEPFDRYIRETLAALVRINSINPAFAQDAAGEGPITEWLSGELTRLGCSVTRHEPIPGRVSVAGTLKGSGGGPSLMLYAHIDTVGVEGMEDPWSGAVRDGRLYGRGAYDMKCGMAACLAAVKSLRDSGTRLRGDVVICAAADEETESLGIRELLKTVHTDAAIVTEPTELDVYIAHKGFCWIEVEALGRAAHGSRYQDGIDANLRMGRFLAGLDGLERRLRARRPHPLLGPPSLHAAVLRGGTGLSTYAASSVLQIERRTVPGESADSVLAEIQAIIDQLRSDDPSYEARARLLLARPSYEGSADSAIARAVIAAARERLGHPPNVSGAAYWMDAALIAEAGIETVVIGAVGGGAHAAVEWVELESVEALAAILTDAAIGYCGMTPSSSP